MNTQIEFSNKCRKKAFRTFKPEDIIFLSKDSQWEILKLFNIKKRITRALVANLMFFLILVLMLILAFENIAPIWPAIVLILFTFLSAISIGIIEVYWSNNKINYDLIFTEIQHLLTDQEKTIMNKRMRYTSGSKSILEFEVIRYKDFACIVQSAIQRHKNTSKLNILNNLKLIKEVVTYTPVNYPLKKLKNYWRVNCFWLLSSFAILSCSLTLLIIDNSDVMLFFGYLTLGISLIVLIKFVVRIFRSEKTVLKIYEKYSTEISFAKTLYNHELHKYFEIQQGKFGKKFVSSANTVALLHYSIFIFYEQKYQNGAK